MVAEIIEVSERGCLAVWIGGRRAPRRSSVIRMDKRPKGIRLTNYTATSIIEDRGENTINQSLRWPAKGIVKVRNSVSWQRPVNRRESSRARAVKRSDG